jgi:hypothetical protein
MVGRFYYLKNYNERILEKDKARYMMLARSSFYVLLVLTLLFILGLVLYAGKFSWAIKSNNVETGRVTNWFRGIQMVPAQCRVIRASREREKMRKIRSSTRLSSLPKSTRTSLPLSDKRSTGRRSTRMASIDEVDVHVDDTLTFDNE